MVSESGAGEQSSPGSVTGSVTSQTSLLRSATAPLLRATPPVRRAMTLGASRGGNHGQNLKLTADKLFKEVQSELDASLSPEDAAFRKQAYDAAMQMRPQEILFELRSSGVDTTGLAEKADLAEELSRVRLQTKKSPPPARASARPRSNNSNNPISEQPVTPASSPPAPHPGGGERADAREEAKLSLLIDMGFTDEDENRRLLEHYKGDVQKVLDHVLQGKRS